MADELIVMGDEIKAEKVDGGVKLGGYLIRFGDATSPDLTGDYFTKDTDFGGVKESDVWFNHRQPVRLKKVNKQVSYTEPLPKATLAFDDIGVFAEVVIEARNEYEKTIGELGLAGKLAWSSGTASHLVDRKSISEGIFEITRWPLGIDASLTPHPAEFRNTNKISQIKLFEEESKNMETKADYSITGTVSLEAVQAEVAKALELRDAKAKAEADQVAAIKAAEDAGYQKAITELKDRKTPAINIKTMLGFAEEKDAVPAFKHWLQTGQVNGGLINPPSDLGNIKAAFNITDGATGGYLVPDPLLNRIIAKRDLASWVRQAPCQYFQTEADHLIVPIEATSHTSFVLTAESAGYDENEGTLDQKDLALLKYTKLVKVTEEFMSGANSNFDAWLSDALGRASALTENTVATAAILSGANVATVSSAANATAAEIARLIGSLTNGYNTGTAECGFLVKNATKWFALGLVTAFANPPAGAGPAALWGYPIYVSDDMAAQGSGTKGYLFANFNFFGVLERPGMLVQRNPYLYMANGQIGIFANIYRAFATLQTEAVYTMAGT